MENTRTKRLSEQEIQNIISVYIQTGSIQKTRQITGNGTKAIYKYLTENNIPLKTRGCTGGANGSGGELKLPDGSVIEYDGDLVYGKKDKNITAAARKEIENWEAKRVKNKVEYAYSVFEDGTPVGKEIKGSKGSVRSPLSYKQEGTTFSHIHPRDDGMLGGTFSDADLTNFVNTKCKTLRAAAKEGTYSISKNSDFKSAEFRSFLSKSGSAMGDYRKKAKSLGSDYMSGKISYDDYLRQNAKAFNTALVACHNELLANQKKYGYTYTLEQR